MLLVVWQVLLFLKDLGWVLSDRLFAIWWLCCEEACLIDLLWGDEVRWWVACSYFDSLTLPLLLKRTFDSDVYRCLVGGCVDLRSCDAVSFRREQVRQGSTHATRLCCLTFGRQVKWALLWLEYHRAFLVLSRYIISLDGGSTCELSLLLDRLDMTSWHFYIISDPLKEAVQIITRSSGI